MIYKCKTCKNDFEARKADRDRGWARYCSKSCKAIKQVQKRGYGYLHAKDKNFNHYDGEHDFHPFDSYSLGQS